MRHVGLALILVMVASCSTPAATGTTTAPTASAERTAAGSASAAIVGLATKPLTTFTGNRHWVTVPDGLSNDGPVVIATFPGVDATPGRPRARLRATGQTIDLRPQTVPISQPPPAQPAPQWTGTLPLAGLPIGENTVEVLVRLADGTDTVVGSWSFLLSQPEYFVWTLDFEGDAASNETMDNVWDIARAYRTPMTIMWNPRVWTTDQVTRERADVMANWTKTIEAAGYAEVALHLHAWTDFVRSAGVPPRTAPSWSGRSDGYDVPLTAFNEAETKALIDHAIALMTAHGFKKPTTFRAGGLFANAANLRAVAAAGFTVDTSATPAGGFGRLLLPWTLRKDAQPYRPSRDDANVPGDLALLEVPNIAGNTYALDTRTIAPVIAADLAMLARAGEVAESRRALTLVSHPGTVDATERAAIEALFRSFEPYRYDRDSGPLRFVTLAQLAKAYAN
jgi:hypothetical protein